MRLWACVGSIMLVLVPAVSVAGPSLLEGAKDDALDKGQLVQIEDLSESLANDLLSLSVSVRDRNLEAIAGHFNDPADLGRMPELSTVEYDLVRFFEYGSIDPGNETTSLGKEGLVSRWKSFLDQFSEIEDVRFKVKGAQFSRGEDRILGDGAIKYFAVTRDLKGQLTWLKGTGHLKAFQPDSSPWKITHLRLDRSEVQRTARDLFSEVSAAAGVAVTLPTYGSPGNDDFVYHGAAAGDFNKDGFLDIVATGISETYLYMNQGDGTFRNLAWELGIPPKRRATAPLPLDFDGDGDLDLFIATTGAQMLFENRLEPEGKLHFLDISLESGVAQPAHGFSAVAGDVNRDGLPDIYVTCYNRYGYVMPNSWLKATNGTPNLLFINRGDGSFKESGELWGVRDSRWSYAAEFADLNGDGLQDLYVANDFGENALYINRGDHFEDEAIARGVLDPGNGMGVSLTDYDNDGTLDLFVTNMSSTAGNRILNRLFPDSGTGAGGLRKIAAGSNLYKGNPDGTFRDVTAEMGPFSTGWAWGGVVFDFDNDGWEDFYSASGFVSGKSMKDT